MLKSFNPIIIIAGDPESVFLEIYFKSLKKNKFKNPLILIVNENILLKQMTALKYDFKINKLDINNLNSKKLNNRKINEELNKIPTIFILVKATKVSYKKIINIKNKNDLFGIFRNLFLAD